MDGEKRTYFFLLVEASGRSSKGEMEHLTHRFRQDNRLLRILSFDRPSLRHCAVILATALIPYSGFLLSSRPAVIAAEKPASSAKAKHGETIFKTQCVACHNKEAGDTTPFGPPNLHGIIGTTPPQISAQEVAQTVKNGKGVMPSFAGKLSPADITDIVAYLKTQ